MLLFVASSCTQPQPPESTTAGASTSATSPVPAIDPSLPVWLRQRIAGYERSEFGTSYMRVMKFRHWWRTYYYFTGLCCEQLDPIMDADGEYVCAPTGEWAGEGDMKCPKSFPDESGMTTVWKDSRLH